jgi:hypothetical protein
VLNILDTHQHQHKRRRNGWIGKEILREYSKEILTPINIGSRKEEWGGILQSLASSQHLYVAISWVEALDGVLFDPARTEAKPAEGPEVETGVCHN